MDNHTKDSIAENTRRVLMIKALKEIHGIISMENIQRKKDKKQLFVISTIALALFLFILFSFLV